MKQDLDEFRNQMEDLYHDRSVKPMKDYYRTKMEKLVKGRKVMLGLFLHHQMHPLDMKLN